MNMTWMLFLVQGALLALLPAVYCQTASDETALRTNLSSGYNQFVPPDTPTVVTAYFNIRSLQDLDISQQKMGVTGWLTMYWNDSRLQWDASTNGISSLYINWAWKPEFVLSNAAGALERHGYDKTYTRVRAYYNGHVSWNYVFRAETSCEVDISKFPFDKQECDLEIVYWGSEESQVNITSLYKQAVTNVYAENAEWILESTSAAMGAIELCCPEQDTPLMRLYFTFSRRTEYYVMNLIIPTVLLSVCMVICFLLPTESGERLGFSLTVLLSYTVQLSITANLMPTTSKQVPQIARYLQVILIICSLVICNVVLHVKLFFLETPVFPRLQAFYRTVHPVVFLQCRSRTKGKQAPDNSKVSPSDLPEKDIKALEKLPSRDKPEVVATDDDSKAEEEVTWAKVSILFDRIAFYLYFVTVFIVNTYFFISITN